MGSSGEGPRGMILNSKEGSTMSNLIICTAHLDVVRVITSRRLTGHVASIVEGKESFQNFNR